MKVIHKLWQVVSNENQIYYYSLTALFEHTVAQPKQYRFLRKRNCAGQIYSTCSDLSKGAFTNYVYKICPFFDHLPPSVYIFYGIKVYKKLIFLTTYPPPLVNVVCERPLIPSTNFDIPADLVGLT